jgi:hypothetical protein
MRSHLSKAKGRYEQLSFASHRKKPRPINPFFAGHTRTPLWFHVAKKRLVAMIGWQRSETKFQAIMIGGNIEDSTMKRLHRRNKAKLNSQSTIFAWYSSITDSCDAKSNTS